MSSHKKELANVLSNDSIKELFEPFEDGVISTIFEQNTDPISWYSKNGPVKLIDKNNVFTCPNYDIINYIISEIELPELIIKDDYKGTIKINWCKDVVRKIHKDMECSINDELILQSISSKFSYFYDSFAKRNKCDESEIEQELGNIDYLREKSDYLPYQKLTYFHPWFFSRYSNDGFPLCLLNNYTDLHFRFNFVLNINKLLEMWEYIDDKWEKIQVNISYLNNYNNISINSPNLYGCFSKLDEQQVELWRSSNKNIFIENNICIKGENIDKCGLQREIKLEGQGLAKAIFFAAHNIDKKNDKDYFNFCLNRDNYKESPIDNISLILGKSLPKFTNIGPELYRCFMRKHFDKVPSKDKGLFAISIPYKPMRNCADTGLILDKLEASLKIKLEDRYYKKWKSLDEEIEESVERFKIIVFIVTMRKLVINYEEGLVYFEF